jgi:hypothetical protein
MSPEYDVMVSEKESREPINDQTLRAIDVADANNTSNNLQNVVAVSVKSLLRCHNFRTLIPLLCL